MQTLLNLAQAHRETVSAVVLFAFFAGFAWRILANDKRI